MSNKNKFNIQGVLDNIKSMINPTSGTPNANPDDDLGMRLASISVKLQELAETHGEQAEKLTEINQLVNNVFTDIEAIRGIENLASKTTNTSENTDSTDHSTEEKKR